MMNDYTTVKLTKEIQSSLSQFFDCGNQALSSFIKSYDALDDFFGTTYVMISDKTIIGYYNISTGHIQDDNKIRAGGVVYINCLAVDKQYQKKKINNCYFSDILLFDCFKKIKKFRESVGFGFVTLSSTDEGHYLYERNGFFDLEDDMQIAKNHGEDTCVPMYFPLDYE